MSQTISFQHLTTEERLELMGRLWDSLNPADAAPITPSLAEELSRREAEADASPDAGEAWADIRNQIRSQP